MSELCEYDPERGQPAELHSNGFGVASHVGCQNQATVSVGRGKWHLCGLCAALPVFKRYTSRVAISNKGDAS
jgi:hypothetical protein